MRMRTVGWLAVVSAVALAGGEVRAEPVHLADGDSFTLGSQRYRLYGIDAPELHQDCTDAAGRSWPCGTRARSELRRIIGTYPVTCRIVATDRFGRSVATCHAGGRDLAEEMVRSGYATVIMRSGFASPYEAVQADARADKRGLWAGRFDTPSDWRRANPRDDAPQAQQTPRDWLARKSAEAWEALSQWMRATFGR
jgi:endonuclease YncB( thermonuclease family)